MTWLRKESEKGSGLYLYQTVNTEKHIVITKPNTATSRPRPLCEGDVCFPTEGNGKQGGGGTAALS